jgi:hypothetical protein
MQTPINIKDVVIAVKGSIFWSDGRRRIDLKKPIRDIIESSELNQNNTAYVMELCLSKQKMIKRIQELLNEEIIPVLLYFTKEDDKNE